MPYRFSRGVGFSVERGAVYGLFAGLVVVLGNVHTPVSGGAVGAVLFGVLMWAVFRDVSIFISWALAITILPVVFMVGVFGGPDFARVLFLMYVPFFFLALSLPGVLHGNSTPLVAYSLAGVLLAVMLGSVLLAVTPFDFGHPHLYGDTDLAEMYVSVIGVAFIGMVGFPAFGACYAAGLAQLYDDEDGELDG